VTSRNLLIGSPIERVEDLRLLRGRGRFVADIDFEDQLHAVILRSAIAHGRVRAVDPAGALALPGVRAVITAQDLGVEVPLIPLRLQPLPELQPFRQPMLAHDKVRYVGEPLAVIVAESPHLAEDALDGVRLDIEPLPAIVGRETAEAAETVLFEDHQSNRAIRWTAVRGDADAAFRAADYTRRETFRVQRHAALFMEPRGFVARWDETAEKMTVWGAAKVAFANRRILAAAMGLREEQIEMIEVDVGGGFGSRGEFYPEDFLIPFAARQLGRPVKWIEDRREHLSAANHARETECDVEIAATSDGRILGLRGRTWTDNGAYLRTNGSVAPRNVAQFMSGPYAIENIHLITDHLTTNKTPTGTYRGPGRFEGDFVRERLIDLMAKDLGIDRAEIRRRNIITRFWNAALPISAGSKGQRLTANWSTDATTALPSAALSRAAARARRRTRESCSRPTDRSRSISVPPPWDRASRRLWGRSPAMRWEYRWSASASLTARPMTWRRDSDPIIRDPLSWVARPSFWQRRS
jgi:carbon-monoxide dehydrogenase large subunit